MYKQLESSESLQKAIFETAVDGVLTIELDGNIKSANASVSRLFGWDHQELIGKYILDILPSCKVEQFSREHLSCIQPNQSADKTNSIVHQISHESIGRRKDDTSFPIRITIGQILLENQILFVTFISDITEQKRFEVLLEREATHDFLTNLPNRRYLELTIPQCIARTDRSGNMFAMLFMDLDGFKEVNDTLGHKMGDELLKIIAQRLSLLVRNTDLVVRLSGDEFIIILEGLASENDAKIMAEKVLCEIFKPIVLGDNEVTISSSIGIAFYTEGCKLSLETLLEIADKAMYRAKNNGKGCIEITSAHATFSTQKQTLTNH